MKKLFSALLFPVYFVIIGSLLTASSAEAKSRWIGEISSTSLPSIMRDDEKDVVYLGDAQNKELIVIDSMQETVIDRIPVPSNNFSDMAMSKDNKTLAVAGGTVTLIDTETMAIKILNPGQDIVSVAFDHKNNLYFTTSEYWGQIYYYDLVQDAIVHSFVPNKMVYRNALVKTDREGKILYVAERGLSPASLYKFDVSGDEPVFVAEDDHGDLGSNLRDFVISPDGNTIYVACGAPYGIQVIDAETIERTALLTTGAYPGGVALDKYGIYVYGLPSSAYNNILYQFKADDGSTTHSFKLLNTVLNGKSNIRGIAVDRAGQKAFIVHGDTSFSSPNLQVQVVDTEVNIYEDAIKKLEAEIEQLKARIQELEDFIASLLSKNQQLLDENVSLKQENTDLQNQLNAKLQEITTLELENKDLKSQLEYKNRYIQALLNYIQRLWDYIRQR